jgi:hypothetical protein
MNIPCKLCEINNFEAAKKPILRKNGYVMRVATGNESATEGTV